MTPEASAEAVQEFLRPTSYRRDELNLASPRGLPQSRSSSSGARRGWLLHGVVVKVRPSSSCTAGRTTIRSGRRSSTHSSSRTRTRRARPAGTRLLRGRVGPGSSAADGILAMAGEMAPDRRRRCASFGSGGAMIAISESLIVDRAVFIAPPLRTSIDGCGMPNGSECQRTSRSPPSGSTSSESGRPARRSTSGRSSSTSMPICW